MPKISEIFDIKAGSEDKKPVNTEEPKSKPKKKREFTEEQKQILRDRLKLGREKMAANRAAKKESDKEPPISAKTEAPVKLENKVAAAMDTPVTDKEVKVVTKYLLELDEGDDMDPKELKAFIKTLYKASKSNIVRDAQVRGYAPRTDIESAKESKKSEALPGRQIEGRNHQDDNLFTGEEEIPRKPTYQVSKQEPKVEPKPLPVAPKISKEEQMRITALAKVKAALAAKKRR